MCVHTCWLHVCTHVTTVERGKHTHPAELDIDNDEVCSVCIQVGDKSGRASALLHHDSEQLAVMSSCSDV